MNDNKIKCQWCDKTAIQAGIQRIGSGINFLSYQCQYCKAIILYIRNTEKEIESIEFTPKYK